MTSLKLTTIALLIAAATAGAHAQDSGAKTREQVRQELMEAMRSGGLPHGEQDVPLRDQRQAATRSRAEVQAEFAIARRNGELLAGDSSQTMSEAHPAQYPARTTLAAGKTRAQVKAELAEAQRNGDMVASGEAGLTLREQHPSAYPRMAAPVYAAASAAMPVRR